MKNKQTQMWIPLYVDKWIFGSTRIELEPAERGVFVDLLAFGAKDQGYIRANETTAYPHTQLAGLLNISIELLNSTIAKCLHFGKIEEPSKGIYKLNKWDDYQFSGRTISRLTDTETGDILDEKLYVSAICKHLEKNNISYKKEKVCDSGRIDIFIDTNPPIVIEVKGGNESDKIRGGMRQLLEYGLSYPSAHLCLALPVEQKNDISGGMNEKLKKYNIELLTYSNFPKQLDSIFRQKDTIREDKRRKEKTTDQDFVSFWQAYPKKVGKDKALESWNKRKPDINQCLTALKWQIHQEQWTKDNGQYIPNPSTWLNQGRWNDEKPTNARFGPVQRKADHTANNLSVDLNRVELENQFHDSHTRGGICFYCNKKLVMVGRIVTPCDCQEYQKELKLSLNKQTLDK